MTVLLLRHGRSVANAEGLLAGRKQGVYLDDTGNEQAKNLVERLHQLSLCVVVSSPLERCLQTVAAVAEAHNLSIIQDENLVEVDYGDWTGKSIHDLMNEPLWKQVQRQPSAVSFPRGESLADVLHRSVSAIRQRDAVIEAEFGPGAVWLACTHGDIIKSVIAHALGMHQDLFQRIIVSPASLSIIKYGKQHPFVEAINICAEELRSLTPAKSYAVVGGETDTSEGSDAISNEENMK